MRAVVLKRRRYRLSNNINNLLRRSRCHGVCFFIYSVRILVTKGLTDSMENGVSSNQVSKDKNKRLLIVGFFEMNQIADLIFSRG